MLVIVDLFVHMLRLLVGRCADHERFGIDDCAFECIKFVQRATELIG